MPTLAIINFKYFYQLLIPGLFAFFAWFNPQGGILGSESLARISFWHCPFLEWTGWACPGCGLTRSMISFFSRDLEACFYFHPLGPVLGIVAVILWACSFFLKDFSIDSLRARLPKKLEQRLLGPGLVLLLAWGILRNILDLS